MNRLAHETSPYLQQHAHNPVDWFPWGPEALERAKHEDKPILLSIGYAACHWCHVMERESFEDAATAALMNDWFVCIKVDREERPDIDSIYMSATQAMTGQGGWPMTVFLTPDGAPFYAGTYFPPADRHGMPSFTRVLRSIHAAYTGQRDDVERTAGELREMLRRSATATESTGSLTRDALDRGYAGIAARYDARHGGFSGAPKFPQAMSLDFLLRWGRRTDSAAATEMVLRSFLAMARGGIYDQIGGGFHRYAVDAVWLVPHFEKMLYDNALLIELGAHLVQATGNTEVARVVEETVAWTVREMMSTTGGFYSSLDADSEGEEGKFYVWSERELDAALGDDAPAAKAYYGASAAGNFEGHNILHVAGDGSTSADITADGIARVKRTLLAARATRVRPGRDEKILASWNGLMLRALAESARVMQRDDWRGAAVTSGDFLFREMVRDGRVSRSHKDGVTKLAGYLEDYAAVGLGALALYDLTLDRAWLERGAALARSVVRWFWDVDAGAFFDTASDHEQLVTRPREVTDNAVPSGHSLACDLLHRVATLEDDDSLRQIVSRALESIAEPMARYGAAFGWALGVADAELFGATEVALIGSDGSNVESLHVELVRHYVPALILAAGAPNEQSRIALLRDRTMIGGKATAYVCAHYACESPVTSAETLGAQLERATRSVTTSE